MNILILAAGTRNKIVQYFRQNLKGEGRVIATDATKLSPAIYEADDYYIVPRIDDPGYLDIIIDICKKEEISGVLSLIDPELGLLARNTDRFQAAGVQVIGSSAQLCDLTLDKSEMYRWLKQRNYRCATSWTDKEEFYRALDNAEVSFPVFVKPAKGSASINISKVSTKEAIEVLWKEADDLMIQEFLNGQEIGADVYIDMLSGEIISIFTKKKLKMRAGETDKAISFKDAKLFALIQKFVTEAGYRGQIDIDIFDIDGEYYISEVNPRFGGGYPHAYESGCNHICLILNNLKGEANVPVIGQYEEGIYMMKYNEISIQKEDRL